MSLKNSSKVLSRNLPFELQSDEFDVFALPRGKSVLYDSTTGTLKVPSTLKDRAQFIELLLSEIPSCDEKVFDSTQVDYKVASLLYRVKALVFFLGYLDKSFPKLQDFVKRLGLTEGLDAYINFISGLGDECQIILTACSLALQKFQAKFQTFSGLDLSFEEIDLLNKVSEQRRLINNEYETKINSKEYSEFSEKQRFSTLIERDKRLSDVTPIIYHIVRMGVSYLTSRERLDLKLNPDLDLKTLLVTLRKSELIKFRDDPLNYSLPKLDVSDLNAS